MSDMTCGHCAGAVKTAVHCVDSQATVAVDLASKTVSIMTSAAAAEISKAAEAGGYPNKAV